MAEADAEAPEEADVLIAFLAVILLEAGVFGVSVYGVKKVTDRMVSRFGIDVEASERMKRMYLSGDFAQFWGLVGFASLVYGVLLLLSLFEPSLGLWFVVGGMALSMAGVVDLLWDCFVAVKSGLWKPVAHPPVE